MVNAEVLIPIPLLVAGCAMAPRPVGFGCVATFVRSSVEIWPSLSRNPDLTANDDERDATQIARLLSLTPRTPEQIEAMTCLP